MIVGDKYRPERIRGTFDVIVVGSGMGGLATAALLALKGKRVLVLERHFTAGGFTHTYTRFGFEWDVGLHYVGAVGRNSSPLRQLFDLVTGGTVEWAPMDEVYDQIHIGDRRYDLHAGRDRFHDGLLAQFPKAGRALGQYLILIDQVQRAAANVFAPKCLPAPLAWALKPLRSSALRRYFMPTTAAVLDTLTGDTELRAVLTGQWGDYGLPPRQSSFGIHALVAGHYLNGGYFPVGGASTIAAGAKKVIEGTGGSVLVRADVKEILIERGKAVGVKLDDGETIRAKTVVSAAGLATTLRRLLPAEHGVGLKARKTLEAAGMSVGHACLYVGLNGADASLELSTTNLWLYPGPDHDANLATFLARDGAPDPLIYISFPSAKNPAWSNRFPGRATVEVIGAASYARFAEWRNQPWRKRGNAYHAYKEEIAERYLSALYKHRPQLEGRVKYYELSTPLSTEHFTNHPQGAFYGIAQSPARFLNDYVHPKTEIPGLYLTGQDVVTAGVGGALISGAITAAAILGWRGLGAAREWLT